MIERDGFDSDIFDVSCDYCSEDIEIDSGGDWQEMLKEIKADGWKIMKQGEEWKHKCPQCAKANVADGLWKPGDIGNARQGKE